MNNTTLLAWTAAGLWAQAPIATGDAWITAVTNFGGLGVLAYVVWMLQQQTRADAKEDRASAVKEREKERAEALAAKEADRVMWLGLLADNRVDAARRHEEIKNALALVPPPARPV